MSDDSTPAGADAAPVRVGVDIGGTFTDIVTVRDGTIRVSKTSSTPDAPEQGVLEGLGEASDRDGWAFDAVGFLGHGTTVATNAVLEEEWAETALLTTEGFRDVLEIGRQNRPDIYDFQAEKATPVVPRDRRYEVGERLDERGRILRNLDEASVDAVAERLDGASVESVAICLLYAFEDAAHERRVRSRLEDRELDVTYSLSSDVLPEIREYERTLATSLNAALKPVMDRYIGNLDSQVAERGIRTDLRIMQSNGGIIAGDVAREQPVRTLLSGPAAGVQGATAVAERCGLDNVITMDMGGTSCDVSLVEDGAPLISTDVEVGEYPVGVPMVDVHTVGSGGGSIAWLDRGDALRVGPRSAGATPGPICYGRGGTDPTITDAHLLLGRLDPDAFLSDLDVDADDVEEITRETLAEPAGQSVESVAQGIVDVANANIQRALRVVSVERGHDPREFGLVAFGGAGPLHACEIARELEIPEVVVPRAAGVLSALGLLVSDVLYDYSTSRVRRLETVTPDELSTAFAEFEAEGRERLRGESLDEARMRFERTLDLRYVGQSFELSVPVPAGAIDETTLETVADRFHDRHERRYGHAYREEAVELVTIRLRARGEIDPPTLAADRSTGDADDALRETRTAVFDGDPHETRVYDGSALAPDGEFGGPAIVEGAESTTVVPPGQRARVDEYGNLRVEVFPDD